VTTECVCLRISADLLALSTRHGGLCDPTQTDRGPMDCCITGWAKAVS